MRVSNFIEHDFKSVVMNDAGFVLPENYSNNDTFVAKSPHKQQTQDTIIYK